MKSRKTILKQITSVVVAAFVATSVAATASASEEKFELIEEKFSYDLLVGDYSDPWDGTAADSFAGGTGTVDDPYLISTAEQLAYLANQVDGGTTYEGQYIELTQNIILNEDVDDLPKAWNPIGKTTTTSSSSRYTHIIDYAFNGTFDGNNYDIVGLYIIGASLHFRGLFAAIDTKGIVKNTSTTYGKIINCKQYIGNIAGKNNGTIENCHNSNVFVSDVINTYFGGICGENTGSVIGCSNSGTVYAEAVSDDNEIVYGEGIAGYNSSSSKGTIKYCNNTAEIYVINKVNALSYPYYFRGVGGISGYNHGTIDNCYNTGNISGQYEFGGIAGYSDSYVTNCFNSGNINGKCSGYSCEYSGGICGYIYDTYISDCYNTGNILCSDIKRVGGICGYVSNGSISKCYNTAEVSGIHAGGICGEVTGSLSSPAVVNRCYNTGVVRGSGICYSNNYIIKNCYNTGSVTDAGICASAKDIINCYNIGKASSDPIGTYTGELTNVYFDSSVFPDNADDPSARTTEQFTADTALADLGFDEFAWSKKANTENILYYPDLLAFDDDQPMAVPAPYMAISSQAETLDIGETVTLTAAIYPTGTDVGEFTWTSSDEDVATVADGVVTAVAKGTADITVTAGSLSDTCTITVNSAELNTTATADVYEVTLTWDEIDAATCYAVLMYENGRYVVLDFAVTDTTYTITDLESSTEYQFLVQANVNGMTVFYDLQDNVTVTTLDESTLHDQPVVTATAGDGEVALSWTAIDEATQYAICICSDNDQTRHVTTPDTSYIVYGLINGTKYGFEVTAYGDNWNTTSEIVYATPAAKIIPENLKIANGDGKVQVTWDEVSGATKYAVYSYYDGVYTTETTTATDTSYTVTGLTNGEKYGFKVKSYVNGKWSAASSIIYARPSDKTAPGAIKAIAGNASAEVKWSGVIGATRYAVYKYENGVYTCIKSNITDTNYTVTGLTNGTKYGFKVKAYVDGAWSAASVIAYATPTA